MDAHTKSKLLVFIFTITTLTSCTVTLTTHNFEMVPNTPIGNDDQFYYVKYGVIGTASAFYDINGGGDVRNGLVADAKANLRSQHLLGPNQAYINMSVDVLQTKAGVNRSQGFVANSVIITVVVETDILEYGTPPENYEPSLPSSGLLPTISNSNTSSNSSEREISKWYPDESNLKYQIGDDVIYHVGIILYDGKILDYDHVREKYRVEYTLESGTLKKKYVPESSLSQPKQ